MGNLLLAAVPAGDVHAADDLVHAAAHQRGAVAHQYIAAQAHRGLGEVEDRRGEGLLRLRQIRGGNDVPTGEVNVAVQAQGDGLAAGGGLLLSCRAVDALDDRLAAIGQHLIADGHLARGDAACVTTVVGGVVADDDLDREAQAALYIGDVLRRLGGLQDLQYGRARVPGGVLAALNDIVAQQRGGRNHVDMGQAQLGD